MDTYLRRFTLPIDREVDRIPKPSVFPMDLYLDPVLLTQNTRPYNETVYKYADRRT